MCEGSSNFDNIEDKWPSFIYLMAYIIKNVIHQARRILANTKLINYVCWLTGQFHAKIALRLLALSIILSYNMTAI